MKNCMILILFTSGLLVAQMQKPKAKKTVAKSVKTVASTLMVKPKIASKIDTTQRVNLRIKSNEMNNHAYYPTGDIELFTHIAHTLKYTQQDIDKKTNGNVLIRFDVDIDSTIKEVRLIRDPCVDCGHALIDIFEKLKFAPAVTKSGTRMRSNMMLEIPVWAH